ncbi:hypothetical protein [uncultured Dokdonia sp.]|uniref:hypothetical protein n=1 Tax=uncultured Dokdonia sp. TaxID=575653 RepID=UPI002628E858|nr:hypothetical protein [uncultured Dokdonia sp.]
MWTYYRDVTLYTLAITLLTSFASAAMYNSLSARLFDAVLIFGIFGTGLGVLSFNYFQKAQYYMYYNLGFTRQQLITRTWLVNLVIAVIFIGIIVLLR